ATTIAASGAVRCSTYSQLLRLRNTMCRPSQRTSRSLLISRRLPRGVEVVDQVVATLLRRVERGDKTGEVRRDGRDNLDELLRGGMVELDALRVERLARKLEEPLAELPVGDLRIASAAVDGVAHDGEV